MARTAEVQRAATWSRRESAANPINEAYQLLHWGFTLAPMVAGADTLGLLTDWQRYLAPAVADPSPLAAAGTMCAVGVIEVAAGILAAIRPRSDRVWGGVRGRGLAGRDRFCEVIV